jgi:hypothetical protein
MTQQLVTNGQAGGTARSAINTNFKEVYGAAGYMGTVANWYPALPYGTLAVGTALAAGSIRAIPMIVRERATISGLAARVITVGTGNCQFAIYASTPSSTAPITGTALATTASVANTATGPLSASLVSNVTLDPGVYWACINSDSAVTCQVIGGAQSTVSWIMGGAIATIAGTNTGSITSISYTQTFGTWPDLTGVAKTDVTNNVFANIYYQIASVP